jgi:hypothetical protein
MKPASSTHIPLSSLAVQYAPAGQTASGIPSVSILPYTLETPDQPSTAIPIPTNRVIDIYNQLKESQDLDTMLRQEIRDTIDKHGYTIDLSRIINAPIPKDLIDFLGRHQAGIVITYIDDSPTHTPGMHIDLWPISGHNLREKHILKLQSQMASLTTSHPTPQAPQAYDPFEL